MNFQSIFPIDSSLLTLYDLIKINWTEKFFRQYFHQFEFEKSILPLKLSICIFSQIYVTIFYELKSRGK
jgi:hypothetical protein